MTGITGRLAIVRIPYPIIANSPSIGAGQINSPAMPFQICQDVDGLNQASSPKEWDMISHEGGLFKRSY